MKNFLKEKLKNKFIFIIILTITTIIGFSYFSKPEIDTNSYVVLIKWKTEINKNPLKKDDRKKLSIWDEIITKADSACVIEWWDGSLTRLWENWKIEIQELNVEKDLSKINLQFKLTKWKTWSNVVSFLWEKSYFKQNFEDIAASVRWTVFDVNLEKDYIYVANHEVLVKKWNKEKIISENNAFSISDFSFIEIKKFISEIKDKTWEKINTEFDKEFLNNLKKDISKKIDLENIDKILDENKTYSELLSQYQKLNFVWAEDSELFKIKNKIKKSLISKAWEEDKKNLVKYSVYDLKDAIDSKNFDSIKDSLSIIWENKDILKKLDINFDLENIWNLSWDIKKYISNFDIPELNLEKLDIDSIKNKADDLKNAAKNKINELKNNFNFNF